MLPLLPRAVINPFVERHGRITIITFDFDDESGSVAAVQLSRRVLATLRRILHSMMTPAASRGRISTVMTAGEIESYLPANRLTVHG